MPIKISNPAIGEIEFEESSVLTFSEGMLGMPMLKRYLLLESPNIKPFYRLQCVDEPKISFLLIDPVYIEPGYREYVEKADSNQSFIQGQNSVVFVVCKVAKDGSDVTANLVAPVVINHTTMSGQQFVLLDSPFDVRHSLTQVSQRKEA